ncbi:MAG: nitrogen regulation protein NR(II) [Dehalococcoidia bacterium]
MPRGNQQMSPKGLFGRTAFVALVSAALLHSLLYPVVFGLSNSIPAIVVYMLPALIATLLVGRRLKANDGSDRLGLALLFVSVACTLVIDTAWSIDAHLSSPPAYPGVYDFPYVASYALFVVAIGRLSSPRWLRGSRRWMFDTGALLAIAAGLIAHFVFPRTDNTFAESAFGVAYFVVDLALMATVLSALYTRPMTFRIGAFLLASMSMAAGDVLFYFHPLAWDGTWIAGMWLLAIGAATPSEMQMQFPGIEKLRLALVPRAFVVVAGVLTAIEMVRGSADDLLIATIGALALVVARQFFSLRAALQTQREETAFRDALLETQSDLGLAMLILEGTRIVSANGAVERALGMPVEELRALESVEDLAFASDREAWTEWLQNPGRMSEARIATRSGEVIEIEVFARWLHGSCRSRLLVVARDVTEKKLTELNAANERRLEGLIALAGGVAHDFNNLLSAILGNVALLRMNDPDAEALESLHGIDSAAHRGAELTRSLLEFANFEPEGFTYDDFRAAAREGVALARPSFPPGVSLHVDLPEFTVPVFINRGQLARAVQNIVLNAVDAVNGTGDVFVELSTSDGMAHLRIRDTGTGIDIADRDRIFEPFYTTKGPGAGAGLGLAISQRVVSDHRGAIEVSSEPSVGSTFTISLPLSAVALTS